MVLVLFILVLVKLPYLKSSLLCSKLSCGMGHNYYGEPAWPNDILYIFPVVIYGVTSFLLGIAVMSPISIGTPANAFATPIEILPEWYFYPTFNLLRILPSKLIGVLGQLYLVGLLLFIPVAENVQRYQNPYRRPVAIQIFISLNIYSIWLGIGSLCTITLGLPLV
mmetsp:Transcript_71940/g.166547  ORF Transcript_71940/g.166547 Transcript_71940/m.166547 type:complete len:166 (+) Transcript_71940:112-609(+)